MKKAAKRNITLVLMVVLICCGILAACNSSVNPRKMTARCIIDGEKLILPIKADKAYSGGDYVYFFTDKSLQTMQEAIKGDTLTAQLFGNDYLLIKKDKGNSKFHYYMVARSGDTDNMYFFFCPASRITPDDYVLIPYHLLGSPQDFLTPDGLTDYRIDTGEAYKTSASIEQFAQFYNSVDIYRVEESSTRIEVYIEGDIAEYNVKGIKIDAPMMHTKRPFAIDFQPEEEVVIYSIIEE